MRALIVAGISLCFYSASAFADEPACVESKSKVQPSFRDTPLVEVIEFFSTGSCKQFIVSSKIKNERITLLSSTPLSREEAYKAFEATLDSAGIAVTAQGKFLKLDLKEASSTSRLSASRLELAFTEGKSVTLYKMPTPGEQQPARFEFDTAEQSISFEFVWSKDKTAFLYEIKRESTGKSERASLALYGTVAVPFSGKVSLLDSSGLSITLELLP